MSLSFDLAFEEAAKRFAKRVPLTRAEFDRLAAWAKTRAFTVATVVKAEVIQDILGAVQDAIDEGLTLDDFRASLDDIAKARGWAGITPWHAETVYRTNVQSAYGSGRLEQQRAQSAEFPFIQIHEVNDSRTRASHRERDGKVLALADARIATWYPPSDYNCRGHAESLTEDEARATGIEPVMIVAEPNPNGFTSPGASDEYEARLDRLDGALQSAVRDALDDFDPNDVDD